jgi:hypothetical protein
MLKRKNSVQGRSCICMPNMQVCCCCHAYGCQCWCITTLHCCAALVAHSVSLQARVSAWSGVPISTAPNTPAAAAAAVQPDVGMAAMAASAGGLPDSSAYPAVLRDALGQVPAQAVGQQMYPNIPPGGVASQFNAAAAAAGDQVCLPVGLLAVQHTSCILGPS